MKKRSTFITMLFAFTLVFGISAQQNKTKEQQTQEKIQKEYEKQLQEQREKDFFEQGNTGVYVVKSNKNRELEKQAQALAEVQGALVKMAEGMNVISDKNTPAGIPIDKIYKNLVVKKMFNHKTETKEVTFKVTNDFEKWRTTDPDDKFIMSINGGCQLGNIKITIYDPSGKIFKEILLDSSANLSWSQYVLFTAEKKYQGTWKAKIEAYRALGYYELKFSIIYAPWPGR